MSDSNKEIPSNQHSWTPPRNRREKVQDDRFFVEDENRSVSSAPQFATSWSNNDNYSRRSTASASPAASRRRLPPQRSATDPPQHLDGIRETNERSPSTPKRDNVSSQTQQSNPSFSDQIAASAIAGTIEFLRLAGGFTLSTTGKLVAPPIHVTRKVILPNLWHATMDYIAHITPTRVKDWFRIISSSVRHFFSVLRNTTKGKLFRHRVTIVGGDLIDCLSSDNMRQVLMDTMGCIVKLSEALHTPETKALLEQLSVLGCRMIDAAASGRNKQLLHDLSTLVWSGCELVADPHTTLALAEVTAYLCYALEMEDAASPRTSKDRQAERRRERESYQKSTYVDPALVTDPETTVEEVILSSLGKQPAEASHEEASVPSNVVANDGSTNEWESGSLRQRVEDNESSAGNLSVEDDIEESWHEKARKDVNVPLLEEMINKRVHRSHHQLISDVNNEDDLSTDEQLDEDWVRPNNASPLEDERPLDHFYRILDETLARKRKDGVNNLMETERQTKPPVESHGRVNRIDRSNEPVTIKQQLSILREQEKSLRNLEQQKLQRIESFMFNHRRAVSIATAVLLILLLAFTAFGCYGVYVFLYPPQSIPICPNSPVERSNDIVIRLVREIVQLDSDENVIARHPDQTLVTQNSVDKIIQCIGKDFY